MSYNQTANPACYPITIQQVKEWCRIDDAASDAELLGLIQAATLRAEAIMNRPIINRNYTLTLDKFPTEISIGKTKVQSVDLISYVDTDGASQTLASSVYHVDLGSEYMTCRVSRAYGQSWPSTRAQNGAVVVTFTAGYGVDWNFVRSDIQQAIAYLVGHYYDNRDIVGQNIDIVPETALAILEAHKVYSI